MKWHEFEKQNPKAVYATFRGICEEVHSQGGIFCHYCYQREGWYCFPCDKIRKIQEKRGANQSARLLESSVTNCHRAELPGGKRFWK
jgi:hypothetical protein